MHRIRFAVLVATLIFTFPLLAQQDADASAQQATTQPAHSKVPTAEGQMKLLSSRLDLTAEQRDKLKPVLDDLYSATLHIVDDPSLSQDERTRQIHEWRWKTDRRIREFLSEEQKTKLDQVEHEYHPELHGDLDHHAESAPHS